MERKIYNGYAFSENEQEKSRINREIHAELKDKHKIYRHDLQFSPDVDIDKYDVVIGRQPGYNHAVYNIIKNDPDLSTDELLLICDGGNLCFGGSRENKFHLRISED